MEKMTTKEKPGEGENTNFHLEWMLKNIIVHIDFKFIKKARFRIVWKDIGHTEKNDFKKY